MTDIALARDLALLAAEKWAQQHGPLHPQADDFGKSVADVARAALARMATPVAESDSQSVAAAVRPASAQHSSSPPGSTGHSLPQTKQVGA